MRKCAAKDKWGALRAPGYHPVRPLRARPSGAIRQTTTEVTDFLPIRLELVLKLGWISGETARAPFPPQRRLNMNTPFFRATNCCPWLVFFLATGSALAPRVAHAQVPPPPLPPPATVEESEGEPASEPAPVPSAAGAEPEAAPAQIDLAGDAAVTTGGAAESGTIELVKNEKDEEAAPQAEQDEKKELRDRSLRRQTTAFGSTGVHRVKEAGSGAAGTFRIHLLSGSFASKNFLCDDETPCVDLDSGDPVTTDRARRVQWIANLSATPLPFLELFATIENAATSNDRGGPKRSLVVGDTSFGAKGFLPQRPGQVFTFGGEMDFQFLARTKGVGFLGGPVNVGMRGLATLDLNNRSLAADRIPLRAHLNLGYLVNNSFKIVEELETTAPPAGRGAPLERTERFGLGISRVDTFELGLATEYIHPYVRPFLEWSIDVPVNRQGYICNRQGAASRGDECLGDAAGLATSPSRLSLGANVFPWQATGLSLKAAFDIGTGGKQRFLEETTPEAPYTFWLGVGYAIDVTADKPDPIETTPELPPEPETRRYGVGIVVEDQAGAPVPGAIIRYVDVPMTGLVASADGQFITQDLPPGAYEFELFAEEFQPGTCQLTIPESAPSPSENLDPGQTDQPTAAVDEATDPSAERAPEPAPDDGPYVDNEGNLLVPMVCKLSELPQIANITGLLVDADTGGIVVDGTVRVTDHLQRSLSLEVDAQGSFQFRNVPFGGAELYAEAPGYLPTILPVRVESRKGLTPHIVLNPRPTKLGVQKVRDELKLARPLLFVGESTELTIKSTTMLEELAVFLNEGEGQFNLEIQVHTDDSGAASYSRRISQDRADHLKEMLVQLGVKASRLSSKGYGPDQPLTPAVSEENREKNNRVQLMLVEE